ncbi:MAG TPA: PAS domain S-box protein, partial [Vicinamibacterales bacterium]|nr:PAS domain S-box protein [Vicinamibacterales bacterium]
MKKRSSGGANGKSGSGPKDQPPSEPSALAQQVETALERSEHRYRQLVENSLGLICTHDLEGTILSVNPAAAKSLGYSPREGPGRSLKDFLAPETRHLFDEYLQRVRKNKTDAGLMRVRARDGTERIWMYRNILYQEPDGEAYVLGHALDVTERVLAERALRESQRQLTDAYEQLDARVQQRTAELRHANNRLSDEIAERQRAEELRERALLRERNSLAFLASATEQLMIAADYDQALAIVSRVPVPFLADWTMVHVAREDGSIQCLVGAHVDPAGDETLDRLAARWPKRPVRERVVERVASNHQPVAVVSLAGSGPRWLDEEDEEATRLARELGAASLVVVTLIVHNKIVGTLTLGSGTPNRFTSSDLAILEDLARRFRLAAERVQLYHEAQEANRLKDEFLATLSHELRTPLNAILGWARILQKRAADQYTARALAVIERNAEAQTRLTEDILDVARIASGKFPLSLESVNLASVVSAVIEGVRPAAQAKGINLVEPIDFPAAFVRGDAHRLQQVVS